ncbi:MAG TPA: DNA repair protein RecO [bacterium]|jgi:DNA repair protein RecO (recombination protein O)|nr:MAG: DNA repair protein RecO [Parcubacteria group bacterium ADurb.Bin115]HNU81115.1 DNA repair protein RecO [bacterium]HOD86735.1 DNA repair protein RecO [bacterium]HPW05705.1 DNA repair protein RecO [bacterium]HQB75993.1 DNA repair protein RecO [bacterium]
MDSTFPTRAIILNRRDWREADRLVSVYTPDYGRLSLVARGARKAGSKLAAHLEPISLSRLLVVKGKGFDYVGAALSEEIFLGIKQDLNKLYFAGEALRNFSILVQEGEADLNLFSWLEKWLLSLEAAGEKGSLDKDEGRFRLALFLWRLFKLLGHEPRLDVCTACKAAIKPGNNYFDCNRGGLLCPDCYSSNLKISAPDSMVPISDNCIKLLRLASGNTWQNLKFSPKILKEWENLNFQIISWLY